MALGWSSGVQALDADLRCGSIHHVLQFCPVHSSLFARHHLRRGGLLTSVFHYNCCLFREKENENWKRDATQSNLYRSIISDQSRKKCLQFLVITHHDQHHALSLPLGI